MNQPLLYPDTLTDDLQEVLGWPNFRCAPIAHLFRDAGADIARKAEAEQAYVLDWLIRLTILHGPDWRAVAAADMQAAQERAAKPVTE